MGWHGYADLARECRRHGPIAAARPRPSASLTRPVTVCARAGVYVTVKRHAQDSPPAAPGATTCNGDSRAAAGLPPPPPQQTDGAPPPAAGCESDVRKLKEVKLMTSRPVELARRQGATLVHLFIYLFISSDRQQITISTNR